MKLLFAEKQIAVSRGWSIDRAKGYIEGETCRKRGKLPSTYVRVGMDDYALGFREGYFVRQSLSLVSPESVVRS